MNLAERPPSKQWAALKYRGQPFAEVWFKPEGQPFALAFRIPRETLQGPGIGQRLTPGLLLKAVAVVPEEVESWCHGDVCHAGQNGSNPELNHPLPIPPPDVTHLEIHVSLKAPPPVVASQESGEPEIALERLQDLQSRWNAILALEATIDQLRVMVESAQAEMETASRRTLTTDEKHHALNADLLPWNKAKSRAHFVLPKTKEFVHRATWSLEVPERKQLGELFKGDVPPEIPSAQMVPLLGQLERLLKERQVLSAQGMKVYHECKGITAEIQGALRTLLSNGARNAKRKRADARGKGKFFKDVRRLTGAD